jgi:hypothetical protein
VQVISFNSIKKPALAGFFIEDNFYFSISARLPFLPLFSSASGIGSLREEITGQTFDISALI